MYKREITDKRGNKMLKENLKRQVEIVLKTLECEHSYQINNKEELLRTIYKRYKKANEILEEGVI